MASAACGALPFSSLIPAACATSSPARHRCAAGAVDRLTGTPCFCTTSPRGCRFRSSPCVLALGRDCYPDRARCRRRAGRRGVSADRLSHLVHVQVLMVGWLWWAAWSLHHYTSPGWKAAARVAVFYVLLGMSSLCWAYIGLVLARRYRGKRRALKRPAFVPLTRHARGRRRGSSVQSRRGSPTPSPDGRARWRRTRARACHLTAFVSGRRSLLVWGGAVHGFRQTARPICFPGLTVLLCAAAALFLGSTEGRGQVVDSGLRGPSSSSASSSRPAPRSR